MNLIKFLTKRKFSDRIKFGRELQLPPCPPPSFGDAILTGMQLFFTDIRVVQDLSMGSCFCRRKMTVYTIFIGLIPSCKDVVCTVSTSKSIVYRL